MTANEAASAGLVSAGPVSAGPASAGPAITDGRLSTIEEDDAAWLRSRDDAPRPPPPKAWLERNPDERMACGR